MDGVLGGGLDIPHSDKRFAGFDKKKKLDAEVHRKYIFGGHVANYIKTLIEDEPEKYQTHFSEYIKLQRSQRSRHKALHTECNTTPICIHLQQRQDYVTQKTDQVTQKQSDIHKHT
ncbi:PREDICTED: 60S ribosomal protein L5-like [Lupinus angustifolius]|uniref:60S ribosomal protein L5-like n=1 Tax=Lupinus angustifolius TaxID=3871 RepID=UPI00092FA21D|nr:PREDICTED: 60S ribosomal protein L5-like [Lupinus angustifolius]